MPKIKTQETNASVTDFLNKVANKTRREDAFTLLKLMESISGEKPKMWGPSIIGFGKYYYTHANGQENVICNMGFSPRAQALALYLANPKSITPLLQKLGKHKLGPGGCLYINKLQDIDLDILKKIIKA